MIRMIPALAMLIASAAAHAQAIGSDVPPPRAIRPIGPAPMRGAALLPVWYRETPPVMFGSSDRFVPVIVEARWDDRYDDASGGYDSDDFGGDFGR